MVEQKTEHDTRKMYQNHCPGYDSATHKQRPHVFLSETPPVEDADGLVSHITCPPCGAEIEKITLEVQIENERRKTDQPN